jgi:hypothetical protein
MRGMVRKLGLAAAAGLALFAAPVAAQDEVPADDAAMMAALSGLFAVEPLTAEQQARLPLAQAVIARIMPPGTLQEMMGGMFNGILGPMMAVEQNNPASVISGRFGYDMTASPEDAAEAAAILDPVWGERRRREAEAVPMLMGRMMESIEPAMRNVMGEMYAVHFTAEELAGIDAFFATPIGANYARKSFAMSSDPRLIGTMMQSMPAMMGTVGDIEAEMTALTADLPPVRGYDDLSEAERTRLAELLQVSPVDLQWQLGSEVEAEAAYDDYSYEYGNEGYAPGPTQPAAGSTPVSKPVR